MEGAAGDGGLQVVDQRGGVDLLAAEVALHERLVLGLLDDPLEQGGAGVVGVGWRGALGGLADQSVQAAHRVALSAERQVERGHARPEGVLAGGHRRLDVRTRVVAPGDDDGTRHPDRRALLPLGDRRRVDRALPAGGGGHDEQRRVGRAQPGAQLTDEVAVAGGVDQIDLRVGAVRRGVHEGSDGQRDRALLADGRGVVVAHGAAVDDGACPGDRARVREEGLDERRLPRT